ncbi:MAG: POTRA domain-containing protein [Vicinamibacterales bacterium]
MPAVSIVLALALQLGAPPAVQPPAGSAPVVRTIEIQFPAQGNVSLVEPSTYLYYIETRPSRPSDGTWIAFDPDSAKADFARLWGTGFLDDLSIEVLDEPYPNGVIGKHLIYRLEEKQRVKLVEYRGSKVLDTSKIEEALKAQNAVLRLDTFFDAGSLRKVDQIILSLMREKGYPDASVTHTIESVEGGPKLAHVTFLIDEGAQVRVKRVVVTGNHAVPAGTITAQIQGTRAARSGGCRDSSNVSSRIARNCSPKTPTASSRHIAIAASSTHRSGYPSSRRTASRATAARSGSRSRFP